MKFILALNALGPIPTALALICIGGSFMLIFKFAGLSPEDIKTGHDIVIAGISFISGIAVASRMQTNPNGPPSIIQQQGAVTPNLPADPTPKQGE